MKFFVTGGHGFIGSAFCRSAIANGHEVLIFDNIDKGNNYDLSNRELLVKLMSDYYPDWVIHLAATPGVAASRGIGIRDIINTDNLLEAFSKTKAKILFLSTGSVYGRQWEFPTSEYPRMRDQESHYANAKLMCEEMIKLQCKQWNSSFISNASSCVILRLGTIIGPGNDKGFIKDFVINLLKDPSTLKTWGDGLQSKSYLHIEDMINAMWKVIAHTNPGDIETYNVSHDKYATIRECIPWICSELGVNPSVSYAKTISGGFGDIPKIQLSNAKLKCLGWIPMISIEQAVRDNTKWIIYKYKENAS